MSRPEVERYSIDTVSYDEGEGYEWSELDPYKSSNGDWVRAEDVAKLKAYCDKLEAERDEAIEALHDMVVFEVLPREAEALVKEILTRIKENKHE